MSLAQGNLKKLSTIIKETFFPALHPWKLCVWQYQFPTWHNTFTVFLPCGVCPKAIKYLSIITPALWSYCIKNKLKHFSILTVALITEAVALWLTSWQLIQRGYTQHREGPSLGWGVTRHHEILQYSSEWYAIWYLRIAYFWKYLLNVLNLPRSDTGNRSHQKLSCGFSGMTALQKATTPMYKKTISKLSPQKYWDWSAVL